LTPCCIGHIDTAFIPQPDSRSSLEIIGRDYRLTIDWTTLTIHEQGQTLSYKSSMNFYQVQDDAFIQAVKSGDRSLILAPYSEAVRTLEATLAANESAISGQPVILS
jgi:hypothetical protein